MPRPVAAFYRGHSCDHKTQWFLLCWSTPLPAGPCPFLVALQEQQKEGQSWVLRIRLGTALTKRDGARSQGPPRKAQVKTGQSLGVGSFRKDALNLFFSTESPTNVLHAIRRLEIAPIRDSLGRQLLSYPHIGVRFLGLFFP